MLKFDETEIRGLIVFMNTGACKAFEKGKKEIKIK